MKAKKKEIAEWSLSDLDVDASKVGLGGAYTSVTGSEKPQTARQRQMVKVEDASATAKQIADFLEGRKLI